MGVIVVIPWRPGCPHRETAFNHVTQWWFSNHPTWSVRVGVGPPGPWRKGCAVRAADVRPYPDDVVVVADADVIPVGISSAVEAVAATGPGWVPVTRWAMPFRIVRRLTREATELVTSGRLSLPSGPVPKTMVGLLEETYVGSAGGGVVVLRGDVFTQIPIDPRFAGYGQEDLSWSLALHRLAGAPMMGFDHLWHLWHPPQERMRRGATVSRGVGSEENLRLWQRYRESTTPTAMRSLIAEAEVEFARLKGVGDHAGVD